MDWRHIKEELIAAFPPGTEQVIDWQGHFGAIVEAQAQTLEQVGVLPVEALRRETSPLTAAAIGLGDIEANMGLDRSEIARVGTIEQRRLQVLSRLREIGPPNLPLLRAVLAPILGYDDPLILEVSRTTLRTLHTRTWSGGETIGGGDFARVEFDVRDDSKVSKAGAQLDLTFESTVNLAELQVELEGPGATTITWGPPTTRIIGRGSRTTVRLYAPEFYGDDIMGNWIAIVDLNVGTNILVGASLFVEGRGRDFRGNNGLGAEKFRWSVVVEASRLSPEMALFPGEVYRAVLAALRRLTHARCQVDVALWPAGVLLPPADHVAIVDDPNCVVDACVCG